jgi:hypothetical protein
MIDRLARSEFAILIHAKIDHACCALAEGSRFQREMYRAPASGSIPARQRAASRLQPAECRAASRQAGSGCGPRGGGLKNAAHSSRLGHGYSSCRMICSSLGLCFCSRPVLGSVSSTRAGLGCPTRSRALSFTALVAENFPGLRLVMAHRLRSPRLKVEYGVDRPFRARAGDHGRAGFFHRDH